MRKKLVTSCLMLIGFILIFLAFITTSNFAGICIKGIEYYILFIIGVFCIVFSLIVEFNRKNKNLTIILIALIILFTYYSLLPCPPQNFVISFERMKNQGCQKLVKNNCNISTDSILVENFDANKDGKKDSADTLFELCKNYYEIETDTVCKRICGC